MDTSFEIIKHTIFSKIYKFILYIFAVFILTEFGLRFLYDSNFRISNVFYVIIIILFFISLIPLLFENLKYIKTGILKLSFDSININDAKFKIEDIDRIVVFIDKYYTKESFFRSHYSMVNFKDGGNNYLSFLKADGTKLSFNFVINYEYETKEIMKIIKHWKEHYPDIVIRER
jgi:hypothetical protein